MARHSLETAGTGLRQFQAESDGASAERPERERACRAWETGYGGAFHATLHPALHELSTRRSLRNQRHTRALPAALPYSSHSGAQPLSHRPGRLYLGRNRRDDGRNSHGFRHSGQKLVVGNIKGGVARAGRLTRISHHDFGRAGLYRLRKNSWRCHSEPVFWANNPRSSSVYGLHELLGSFAALRMTAFQGFSAASLA